MPVTLVYTTDQSSGHPLAHAAGAQPADDQHRDRGPELANAAVSTRVLAGYAIVSERAMYWGTIGGGWRETHDSFGATAPDCKWGLAEGRSGGTRGYQTVACWCPTAPWTRRNLRVTFLREDSTPDRGAPTPCSRTSASTSTPAGSPKLRNWNFATIVESTNGVPINVESAIYWNVNGVIWESGGNTMATRPAKSPKGTSKGEYVK